jgi:hypothetical protein
VRRSGRQGRWLFGQENWDVEYERPQGGNPRALVPVIVPIRRRYRGTTESFTVSRASNGTTELVRTIT